MDSQADRAVLIRSQKPEFKSRESGANHFGFMLATCSESADFEGTPGSVFCISTKYDDAVPAHDSIRETHCVFKCWIRLSKSSI